MTRHDVTTPGGVRLAYDEVGRPGRAVVVLLHALGERRSSWQEVAALLAERHHVLSLDLRGHGDSDWPGSYSFELMAEDVVGALEVLGHSRVALVGHSMGAAVAYLIAVQRPDLVERLVVEDAPPPYERDRPLPVREDEAVDFDWDVVPAIVSLVNQGDPRTWAALPTIAAPTLVVAGGPGSPIPQDLLAEVARLVPRSALVTIPVGHHVHAARPGQFAQVVLEWLASEQQ